MKTGRYPALPSASSAYARRHTAHSLRSSPESTAGRRSCGVPWFGRSVAGPSRHPSDRSGWATFHTRLPWARHCVPPNPPAGLHAHARRRAAAVDHRRIRAGPAGDRRDWWSRWGALKRGCSPTSEPPDVRDRSRGWSSFAPSGMPPSRRRGRWSEPERRDPSARSHSSSYGRR